MKDGVYVLNIAEFKSIRIHRIDLSVNGNNGNVSCNVAYADSYEVEHLSKEVKKFIGNIDIITNIYRHRYYNKYL